MVTRIGKTLFLASLALFTVKAASADTITYTLGAGNSAITPAPYSPYYGSVLVNLTSSTSATITFTADPGYLFLSQGAAAVNVNASSFSYSGLTGSNSISGFSGPSLSSGGSGQEDGFGNFNQTFDEFDGFSYALQTISFTLTDNSGTWASAANVLTGNNDGNLLAAHVGICNTDPCTPGGTAGNGSFSSTGYASETGATNVTPEPSSLLMLGTGMLGAAGVFRRKLSEAIRRS